MSVYLTSVTGKFPKFYVILLFVEMNLLNLNKGNVFLHVHKFCQISKYLIARGWQPYFELTTEGKLLHTE